jgi:hypothetical protein
MKWLERTAAAGDVPGRHPAREYEAAFMTDQTELALTL